MKRAIALVVALAALAASAAPAQATFHLMKIVEVGQSSPAGPDYVVLQMYAPGQNLVGGKLIRSYDNAGNPLDTFTFPSNVTAADSQRTIYVARDDGLPLGMPDFVSANLVVPANGAVCFGASMAPGAAIDCVSYGTFPGVVGGDPSPMGTPAPAPAPGEAIHRSIAPGCATLLENADDTDNGAADFTVGSQTPRNNATAPTEVACTGGGDRQAPQTSISKGPKKKSSKTTAKFRFDANEPGVEFTCKLDKAKAKDCTSPQKYKHLDPGKHKFTVAATDAAGNEDPSPASYRFKITKRR